jgi:LmbE family N-acetylglucosaminyl deacetylase
MKISLLIALLFLSFMTFADQTRRMMVVVAHPDDETALAEVLVKYANLGYKVHLVIATDGKDGTRVTNIPAGDSLGNLRKMESRCACEKIAIESPVFLGIDRLDTRHGVGVYFNSHEKLLTLLKEQIETIQPNLIITFGPDGDTHHAEHIVIGAAVTELLLKEGWVSRYPLYYVAWTEDQGKLFDLGFVHDQYFNIRIEYTQEEENKALEIMPCYTTQYTEEEIAEDRRKKINDLTNVLHFRRFTVKRGMRNKF